MKYLTLVALWLLSVTHGLAAEKKVISSDHFSAVTVQQRAFWNTTTPLQLLKQLENQDSVFLTVDGTCFNFVRDEDVPELMALIDSPKPCASLVSSISSQLPSNRSSVGEQAAYLIECYRDRMCPLELTSEGRNTDREALKRWYSLWRLQAPERFPALKS